MKNPKLLKYGIISLTSLLLIIFLFISFLLHQSRSHYLYDSVEELELSYSSTKLKLVEECDKYIQSIAPTSNLHGIKIVDASDKYDIDIRLILSQGAIESHFGTKGLAARTNSVFNVGAYDNWSYCKIFNIHKYPHPDKSIEPYCELLKSDYLGEDKIESDLYEKDGSFVNKSGKRYASDKSYESNIRVRMTEISKSTCIDSLVLEYRSIKVKLGR